MTRYLLLFLIFLCGCSHMHTESKYGTSNKTNPDGTYSAKFNILIERGKTIWWWQK